MRKTYCAPVTSRTMLAASVLLFSLSAFGHIKNEASQFPDIEYSDARFDIVMLVGAGIIPETPVFEPDKTLSRRELAAWVALSRGLKPGGETPDTAALADAAREAGLVDPLDGDATFGDLDALFFGGEAEIGDPDAVPTKAEAASFIASHLQTPAGLDLLESRGLEPGNTGVVASVETREGHHGNVYVITVGETGLPMDAHGRVANGPTDLLQWEGRLVRRSFLRRGESPVWTYLEAQPPAAAAAADAPLSDAAGGAAGAAETPPGPGPVAGSPGDAASPPVDRRLLVILVAAVVILGFVLFFRRRRS